MSVSFFRIIKALCELAPNIISWPNNLIEVKEGFNQMGGINGIVGAIDGTFIEIKAPSVDPEVYVTRKCNYAITLQAICDHRMMFTDCYVGWPGSVSDTRIFNNSNIYRNITQNVPYYFPNNEFIIGDKAYTVLSWCLAPYINRNGLTDAQLNFNIRLSKCRQIIERCFALLFGRFRRLKYLDMNKTDFIPCVVLACTVLHNLCLSDGENVIDQYIAEGEPHVQGNGGQDVDLQNANHQQQVLGNIRRDQVCQELFRI